MASMSTESTRETPPSKEELNTLITGSNRTEGGKEDLAVINKFMIGL